MTPFHIYIRFPTTTDNSDDDDDDQKEGTAPKQQEENIKGVCLSFSVHPQKKAISTSMLLMTNGKGTPSSSSLSHINVCVKGKEREIMSVLLFIIFLLRYVPAYYIRV